MQSSPNRFPDFTSPLQKLSIWFLKSVLQIITDIYAGCFCFPAGSSNALDWAEPTGHKRGWTTYWANRKSSCWDVWSRGCISLSTLLNSHRHRGENQTRREEMRFNKRLAATFALAVVAKGCSMYAIQRHITSLSWGNFPKNKTLDQELKWPKRQRFKERFLKIVYFTM